MKVTARFLRDGLFIAVVMTVLALTGTHTSRANSGGDCEIKREACIKSCLKQREACDKNNPSDPDYCIKQQNRCDKGCNDAWKKCSEKP